MTTTTRWTARRLRLWRESHGWTQEEAAAWYGCTRQAWSLWELGDRPLPRPLLLRLETAS